MLKDKPRPRHNFARSLKLLMAKTGMSAAEVAKRAHVDRKTINNQVNGRYDPRPEVADAVAEVFGFAGWQLLSHTFHPDKTRPADDSKVSVLLGAVEDLTDEQVGLLVSVARGMAKSK